MKLLSLPTNQGKGAAVRRGVLASVGDQVLYMDADLATPMAELEKLRAAIDDGADVAFGSRGLPSSNLRRTQGKIRESMGRTFNVIVQRTVLHGASDTQCGFKLLTARAAKAIFQELSVSRFAFDVEVLLLAHELGFRLKEVPIEWYHDPQSSVSPVFDAARMLVDVIRLRVGRGARRRLPGL